MRRIVGALLAGLGIVVSAVAVQAQSMPFTEGFESGNSFGSPWTRDAVNGFGVENTVARTGSWGIRETGFQQTNSTDPAALPLTSATSTTGVYVRLWVRSPSIDAGSFGYNYTTIRVAYLKYTGCTHLPCDNLNYGFMYLSASGSNFKLGIQDDLGTTHTGTASMSFASNAWHELEFFLSDNGSGTYTYQSWVDGTADLNGTVSGSGQTGTLDYVVIGDQRYGASDTFYADDFAVDTSYIS